MAFIVFAGVSLHTEAYESFTHALLTSRAYSQSCLGKPEISVPLLANLGLKIGTPSNAFGNVYYDVYAIAAPTVAIVWPASGAFFTAPASLDITATAAQDNGTLISVVFVDNGTTVIGTATTAPYTFRWTGVAAGTHVITAKANGSGGQTISDPVTITVGAASSVTATTPSGATLNSDQALVTGMVQAPPNSAVLVNGLPALVTPDGQFFANDLVLAPGPNTVSILMTTQDGESITQSVTINGAPSTGFGLNTDIADGVAPLAVNFSPTTTGATPFASATLDFDGDGNADLTITTMNDGSYTVNYPSPGIFKVRMTVKDTQQQVVATIDKVIHVFTFAQRESLIRGVYQGMVERLIAGNMTGAMNALMPAQREIFQDIFTALGSNLASAAAQLGTARTSAFSSDIAQVLLTRDTPQGPKVFAVHLIRGGDGIWRIEGM
jgi:Bacterial Ig domain/Glucodextranase, domain B